MPGFDRAFFMAGMPIRRLSTNGVVPANAVTHPPELGFADSIYPDSQTIIPRRIGPCVRRDDHEDDHACSACNSFKIASPISFVLTAVVPSDLISEVRRPLASTAAIAASSLSASAPMSNE